MTDLTRREVGWVITDEEDGPSRVGWGQLRVHADETEISYDRVVGRTIFMDKSLTSHMIPDAEQVRWISASDDGDLNYEGIVRIGWLLESDGDDDLAYNIDRFCAEDAGDAQVWYSVDDIIECARRAGNVAWEDFAVSHPGPSQIAGHSGLWIQVYS
jgi:hypothetical protein